MQQEQEKKVIIERQTKLHSELHKIKKSNDAADGNTGAASVQGGSEGNVGGSNAAAQLNNQPS